MQVSFGPWPDLKQNHGTPLKNHRPVSQDDFEQLLYIPWHVAHPPDVGTTFFRVFGAYFEMVY